MMQTRVLSNANNGSMICEVSREGWESSRESIVNSQFVEVKSFFIHWDNGCWSARVENSAVIDMRSTSSKQNISRKYFIRNSIKIQRPRLNLKHSIGFQSKNNVRFWGSQRTAEVCHHVADWCPLGKIKRGHWWSYRSRDLKILEMPELWNFSQGWQ